MLRRGPRARPGDAKQSAKSGVCELVGSAAVRRSGRISRLAGWLAVLMPLVALQSFPLALISPTTMEVLVAPFLVPVPDWERPHTGCMGQPLGTEEEVRLELLTRLFESVTLLHGVFAVIQLLATVAVVVAFLRGRRREIELLSWTAWMVGTSETTLALFFVAMVRP